MSIAALVALLLWAIAAAATQQRVSAPSRIDLPFLVLSSGLQASLSTLLSLAVGIALAWALNRLRFRGRGAVVALFASAIVTPGLIVAFGLLSVWGRSGWISTLSQVLVGKPFDTPIFGLGGILAAHVILNGAFAARILLVRLDSIPPARLKTGQSLALSTMRRFLVIDWPAIGSTLPGLAAIIFLLTFTSFPIVLLLGGGPANQTLEVAIYSAVRLDFDLHGAVVLALVQIGICSAIILTGSMLAPVPSSLGRSVVPAWRDHAIARGLQWLVLLVCIVGFSLPLLAVLAGGLDGALVELAAHASFWTAAATSLVIAGLSAMLTLMLALWLTSARAAVSHPLLRLGIGAPAYAYLAVPAVVLALGFFLLVRSFGIDPGRAAPAVVVVANALLALPFATAALGPPLEAIVQDRGKLIRSLDLSGSQQFVMVEWPLIAHDVGVVLAMSFCFSLGDLGVIALFGTQDFTTLPLLMVRAFGAYRTNDAAAIAAVMLVVTFAIFALLPALFGRFADARAR